MRRWPGFSLLELLAVLAILGVLMTLVLPSLGTVARRAHRDEATRTLIRLAAAQESHYLRHWEYADDLGGFMSVGAGGRYLSDGERYQLSLVTGEEQAHWELRAVAQGPQSRDTDCRVFVLDSLGRRRARDADGQPAMDCW